MLVTTGHFTKEALSYAQKISPRIEMIDRPLLAEMATRAGITIISRGERLSIWTFPLPDETVTRTSVSQYLESVLEGYPRRASLLLRDINRTIRYRPIYLITYDVHAVFSTTVGVIHSEHARQARLAIDGATGELLDQVVKDFIVPEAQSPLLGVPKETPPTATGQPTIQSQRMVDETELNKYFGLGWQYITTLASGKIIVGLPS